MRASMQIDAENHSGLGMVNKIASRKWLWPPLTAIALCFGLMMAFPQTGLAATGDLLISGQTIGTLSAQWSGTGWSWNPTAATMTIDNTYGSGWIYFRCEATAC